MPPKPPCSSVQAAVRWRACGEVRARAGNKPLMGRHYLEVVHGGKFSVEVSVYGKNIPEPIKEIFTYSVSVEELRLSIRAVMGLTIVLRDTEIVLDFTKRLVSYVKRHVASADINDAVLKCVEKKVKSLHN